ncbi:MAG: TIM barrel protein, partial [Nanoarchaeota archaeon]|nr:TIM barrel protein [Nanoarchaeota archaeon]
PAGIGPVKFAVDNLQNYHKLGISACEVEFVRQVYIKKDEAVEIGSVAKELGIELSVHCPYYVNLNSEEKEKVEASKKRILQSCEVGHLFGAKSIVFHCGFYGKRTREETFENIKNAVVEIMSKIKKNNWDAELCPEVMGKINVFGSVEEIEKLSKETGCGFCIDFAHVLARYGKIDFENVERAFPQKHWHCHFSGIEYGDKGEKRHIKTTTENWKNLLGFLRGLDKEIVIINESPTPTEDSVEGVQMREE